MKIEVVSKNFGSNSVPQNILCDLVEHLQTATINYDIDNSKNIRGLINQYLERDGWAIKSKIDPNSKIYITASKGRVGLCVQTGNISRFYADILKLETLYKKNRIMCGIIIVPSKVAAKKINSNVVNSDRIAEELDIFKHTITIPLVLVCFE